MDFSNRHTNEFVYACDLERVLGGVFVCHAGVGNSVNVEYKGITKRFTPRPILGEGRVRVHSDFVGVETPTYKNICHPEFISGSYQRCISPFNVSCHCEQSEAIQENCHAELVSASYQREMDKFSVNHDNGIFPPVQSKIASLRNGGIVMLRLPKPCTSASLFRLHIGSRIGGVK